MLNKYLWLLMVKRYQSCYLLGRRIEPELSIVIILTAVWYYIHAFRNNCPARDWKTRWGAFQIVAAASDEVIAKSGVW
jgi:hypothetical protein